MLLAYSLVIPLRLDIFLQNIFPKIMNCLQLIHISRYIDFDILNDIENVQK